MKKNEMKDAKINKLILDLACTSSTITARMNAGDSTKQLSKHMMDVMEELKSRGMLTDEDIEIIQG